MRYTHSLPFVIYERAYLKSFFSIKRIAVKDNGFTTIKESIKECEVKRLVIHSVEPGMGFEESSVFDKDEGDDVSYESRDLYKDPWCEYLDDDEKDETLKKEPELE